MKQILHILAKDIRHLRVEILFALAIVAAQCWLGPAQWAIQGPQFGATPIDIMRAAASLMLPIMLIAWALLIARAVHAEPLVGDRQFWITRPYAWKKLLAAKLILITLFICLPFFALQCVLVAEAGFSPLPWIPRILLTLLLISASDILPLIAIASVTSSFGRVALVLVGVIFYALIFLAVSAIEGHLVQPSNQTIPAPLAPYLTDLILFLASALVLLLQFSARRTPLSRLLLIAAVAVCCAIGFIDPDRLLMNHNYPPAGEKTAMAIPYSFAADQLDQVTTGTVAVQMPTRVGVSAYQIAIPLRLTGIAKDSSVSVDAVNATFEASNGVHWSSGWQPQDSSIHLAKDVGLTVIFAMPSKVYSRLKNVTAGVHLTLATTEMKAGRPIEMQLPQPMQEFSVPGVGICKTQAGFSGDAQGLACRFPFQVPLTNVSVRWSDQPCSQPQSDAGMTGAGWVGSIGNSAPGLDFFPVQSPRFPLSQNMRQTSTGQQSRNLCPGTPVTFTPYQLVRRTQTTFDWPNFPL